MCINLGLLKVSVSFSQKSLFTNFHPQDKEKSKRSVKNEPKSICQRKLDFILAHKDEQKALWQDLDERI